MDNLVCNSNDIVISVWDKLLDAFLKQSLNIHLGIQKRKKKKTMTNV